VVGVVAFKLEWLVCLCWCDGWWCYCKCDVAV